MLIPVEKKIQPDKQLEATIEHMIKLFWTSELVGHTKPHMEDFDLGEFRAKILRGENPTRLPARDWKRSPHFTRYSFQQALRFAK